MAEGFILIYFILFLCNFFVKSEGSEVCTGAFCGHRKHSPECIDFQAHTLTTSEKKYIILLHSVIRKHLAKGMYRNLPKAVFMDRLQWNETLAEMAHEWASQCKSTRDPAIENDEEYTFGQNVAILEGSDIKKVSVQDLVKTWLIGFNYLNAEIVNSYRRPRPGEHNYETMAQIIKWNTTQFGCGVSEFKPPKCKQPENCIHNNTMVNLVCNYFPGSLREGERLYVTEAEKEILCQNDTTPLYCQNSSTEQSLRSEDNSVEEPLDNVNDPLVNKEEYNEGPRQTKTNSGIDRIRSRLTELWPAAGKAASYQGLWYIHSVLVSLFLVTFYSRLCGLNLI